MSANPPMKSTGANTLTAVNDAGDTEDDAADLFVATHADNVRYVAAWSKWLEWNGSVWKVDDTLSVYDKVRHLCRVTYAHDSNLRKKMLNAGAIASVERLAKADRRVAATIDQWDTDDWLLNTPGGMIDLSKGETYPHDPAEHCTKITAATPRGDCPNWRKFLDDVTNGDKALQGFLQRMAGYGCTGSTKEHALFFCYGTGGNGKGTFLNTLHDILNDYAVTASMDVFTESRHDRHPTELAALQGARLVIAQETDEGRKWAEAKLKALTGGDPITARYMRQDFFTFLPKFTLIIAGNHKPSISNVDEAMRRRLHLVPFTVTIPKEKRDPDLMAKLKSEADGILHWLVEGVAEYCHQGLNPPEIVTAATEEYFNDEDTFKQWIEECCNTEPHLHDTPTRLFDSWKQYAIAANLEVGTKKTFKASLESQGFSQGNSRAKGGRHYAGIEVKPPEMAPDARDYWE